MFSKCYTLLIMNGHTIITVVLSDDSVLARYYKKDKYRIKKQAIFGDY